MDEEASVRRQLTAILRKTASAADLPGGSFWVGEVAGERRVLDDLRAGRLAWRSAHQSAQDGLDALDGGDLEMASAHLTSALWLYIDVLEKRVRKQDMQLVHRPAGNRGRPRGARSKKGRLSTRE